MKALSMILGVMFLAGCASTKCPCTTSVAEPVAAVPAAVAVAAPMEPVVVPEPEAVPETPAQEESEAANIPAAVRK